MPVVEPPIQRSVLNLFALVREALARATWALLNGDMELGQAVVDGDQDIDELTSELELMIWSSIEAEDLDRAGLREHVGLLLLLPNWSAAPTSPSTSRSVPSPTWGRR